jgi:hypothetical protein
MRQLTFTDFIITLAILLGITLGVNYLYRTSLLSVADSTRGSMGQASRSYR